MIDQIDTPLSTYKSPEERIKTLSDGIIPALMLSNPIRYLKDIINLPRFYKGIKKASGFVAMLKNITQEEAQLMLKTMVLTSPYSSNNFSK